MGRIADKLTCYIISKDMIPEEDYELYCYGFLTGLELLVFLLTSLLLSAYFGKLSECIVFLLVFISIRSFAGGLHLERFISCFLLSCTVLPGTLFLSARLSLQYEWTLLLTVGGLAAIRFIAPVDNHNRPTDDAEQQYFSRKLNHILLLILAASVMMQLFRLDGYLTLVMVTLQVIMWSMLLGKIKDKAE